MTKHISPERVIRAIRRLSQTNNQLFIDFLLLKFGGLSKSHPLVVSNTSTKDAIDLLMNVRTNTEDQSPSAYINFNPFATEPWRVADYGRTGPLSNIDGATFRRIIDSPSEVPRKVTLKGDYIALMSPSLLSRRKQNATRIPLRDIAVWAARANPIPDDWDEASLDKWFIDTFKILPEERKSFFTEHVGDDDLYVPGSPNVEDLTSLIIANFPPPNMQSGPNAGVVVANIDDELEVDRIVQAKEELPEDLLDLIRNELVIPDVTIRQLLAHIRLGKNVILTGPPGTGKTTLAMRLAQLASEADQSEASGKKYDLPRCDGWIPTTATADWTTFDTIGGYVPSRATLGLEFREGLFLQAIAQNKWLIIDELNRADADKAFGQLFTVLSGQRVDLPFQAEDGVTNLSIGRNKDISSSGKDEKNGRYTIGQDWRIVASMNNIDRSHLFQLSSAFVRRFAIVHIPVPTLEELEGWLSSRDLDGWALVRVKKLILSLQDDRPIGPAILQDLIEYLAHRLSTIPIAELQQYHDVNEPIIENPLPNVDPPASKVPAQTAQDPFLEAIVAFILPQMEGLDVDVTVKIRTALEQVVLRSSVLELRRQFRDLFMV